ncbi:MULTISPECIES: TIGR02679 domain-containing protein [Cohnella]|uniref:TIGR02679 domain-containing protein n=1 Tax=Cohnella TaxID=329857 RepID=UPI0009BADA81|nr:hypothetical protein [Cohnella algarum]
MEEETGAGSRAFRECYRTDREAARTSLATVARVLKHLFDEADSKANRTPIRLPVLAARISGDAHALDPGTPAGRMLIAVLRYEKGLENRGTGAFERRSGGCRRWFANVKASGAVPQLWHFGR